MKFNVRPYYTTKRCCVLTDTLLHVVVVVVCCLSLSLSPLLHTVNGAARLFIAKNQPALSLTADAMRKATAAAVLRGEIRVMTSEKW